MSHKVSDRVKADGRLLSVVDRSAFYTPKALGKSRRVTPEGYVVCEGVAIARTGSQFYTADELQGFQPRSDGLIEVIRTPEEVFDAEAMASFEGKPVTIEHPADFVGPHNIESVQVGTIHNVRQGDGDESELLIADLVITKLQAIKKVNDEFPEISCGYDVIYEQNEPGKAFQKKIRGNHTALVSRGRAGPRCSIRDEEPQSKEKVMSKKLSLMARLFQAKDDAAVNAIAQEIEQEERTTTTDAKLDALTKWMDECKARDAKQESDAAAAASASAAAAAEAKSKDAAPLSVEATLEVKSIAGIIAPTIAIPTGDQMPAAVSVEFMRSALQACPATDAVKTLLRGRSLNALTADALMDIYAAVGEVVKTQNAAPVLQISDEDMKDAQRKQNQSMSERIAQINAQNAKHYGLNK